MDAILGRLGNSPVLREGHSLSIVEKGCLEKWAGQESGPAVTCCVSQEYGLATGNA